MALSEHEQTVLTEMETALRGEGHGRPPRPPAGPARPGRHVTLAIGLVLAGAAVIALGLWLHDPLGTGLGVLGFVFVTGAGWYGIRLVPVLRRWAITPGRGRGRLARRP